MKLMAENEQNRDDSAESQGDSDQARSKPSPLKNPRVRIILLIVIAVAVIGGVLWYVRYQSVGKFMQGTDDAYIQADAVTISPKVSGYVDKVFVADNQQVKAGTPLLQIDARDYNAQAAQVEALVSPRQSARPLAWSGAAPAAAVAKPAGEAEALARSAAARRFRFAWNVLLAA